MRQGLWNLGVCSLLVASVFGQSSEDLDRWSAGQVAPVRDAELDGITLEADLVVELTSATPAGSTARYLSSMRLAADLDELVGASGWSAFVDVRSAAGRSVSDRLGDVSGVSNLEGDATALSELWLASAIGAAEVRVGLLDANAHFAALEPAENFFNASVGTSPTLLGIPTWPETAVGAEWVCRGDEGWQLAAGLFAGSTRGALRVEGRPESSDGLYLIAETGYRWDCGRVGFGHWHDTGDFELLDGGVTRGTSGSYALAEWTPYRERDDSPEGLTLFGSLGLGEEGVADAHLHSLVGGVYQGLIPRRENDALGLMISRVQAGSDGSDRPESATELFYRAQVLDEVSLTASVQHLANPGGSGLDEDALVVGFRMELTL